MNESGHSLVRNFAPTWNPSACRKDAWSGQPATASHVNSCARRLREIGCEPWRGDDFEMPVRGRRRVVLQPGRGRPRQRPSVGPLLVGAHYDSVIDAPCADDNAAAVAIALAVAGRVAESGPLERDLVVAIFDAEEPPYFLSPSMGSRRFWEDQRDDRQIHAAVIMDLVGHDVSINGLDSEAQGSLMSTLAPLLFMTGTESHPGLRGVLERAGDIDQLRVVPTLNRYVGDVSDHGVFRENGVPYFFLSCGRWKHYHRHTDTPDRLNYDKMERISRQVLAFATALDSTELPQRGSEQFSETLDLEISGMRRAFGSLLKPMLGRCGLEAVTTRSDVDRLVATLLRLGV